MKGFVKVDEICECEHLQSRHLPLHPSGIAGAGECSLCDCPRWTWVAFVRYADSDPVSQCTDCAPAKLPTALMGIVIDGRLHYWSTEDSDLLRCGERVPENVRTRMMLDEL